MSSKSEFLKEEKDCADILGVSLAEYHESLKNIKVTNKEKKANNYSFDNSILNCLGLDEECLKKRKNEV